MGGWGKVIVPWKKGHRKRYRRVYEGHREVFALENRLLM